MNGHGKSDGPIVPRMYPNKGSGAPLSAEGAEGRGPAKGNAAERTRFRTQRRVDLQRELSGVRQAAQWRTARHAIHPELRLRV